MKHISFYSFSIIMFLLIGCKSPNKKENDFNKNRDSINKTDQTDRSEHIKNYKKTLDSINKNLGWTKTEFGLYQSKNGDLAVRTSEATEEGVVIEKYIKELADGRPINKVIDTKTFSYIGSSFYKDKNHIYTHFAMVDGGNFWIVDNADVKTFRVLGNCYAKDKNKIFTERNMETDTIFDYQSFRTCDDCGCFAKDKKGYYFWDEKIDINDIEDKETETIITKLKKL